MSDEVQDPEEQHAETLASGASGVHFFKGIKLQPFSWGRNAALQRLLQDELSILEAHASIVYLCTLDPNRVAAIRGAKERATFLEEVGEWAETQGVKPGNEVYFLLNDTAVQIWLEYTAAQTVPVKEGGGSSGEPSLAA